MLAHRLARLANACALCLPGRLGNEVAQVSRQADAAGLRLCLKLTAHVGIQPK